MRGKTHGEKRNFKKIGPHFAETDCDLGIDTKAL